MRQITFHNAITSTTIIFLSLTSIEATITTLPEGTGKTYDSLPSAVLGPTFNPRYEYEARLQVVPNDLTLCDGNIDDGEDDDYAGGWSAVELNGTGWGERVEYGTDTVPVVPEKGMPVAILARRGRCSFETKAKVASAMVPNDVVRYLIIYDDRSDERLIDMANRDGRRQHHGARITDGIDVGVLFISKKSGDDLIRRLHHQSVNTRQSGGIQILLDYNTIIIPYDHKTYSWIGIFLLIFACVGSFSCFFNNFVVSAANAVGAAATGGGGVVVRNRRRQRNLLTEDDVMTLPEVQFAGATAGGVAIAVYERPVCQDEVEDGESAGGYGEEGSHRGIELGNRSSGDEEDDHHQSLKKTSSEQSPLIEDPATDPVVPAPTTSIIRFQCKNSSCSICLEDYEEGNMLRALPCLHAFHSECILPWLTARSPTCPLCKAYFVRRDELEEGGEGDDDNEEEVHPVDSELHLEAHPDDSNEMDIVDVDHAPQADGNNEGDDVFVTEEEGEEEGPIVVVHEEGPWGAMLRRGRGWFRRNRRIENDDLQEALISTGDDEETGVNESG